MHVPLALKVSSRLVVCVPCVCERERKLAYACLLCVCRVCVRVCVYTCARVRVLVCTCVFVCV